MISLNSTSRSSGTQLLKLSQAAAKLGMSVRQARYWLDQNLRDEMVISTSGHRYVPARALESACCGVPEPTSSAPRVILAARVSSESQSKKRGNSKQSDLDRQIELLENYINNKWNDADVTKSIRIASGCNFEKLGDLLKLIWSGEYDHLVCKDFSRLMRIGWEVVVLACEEFHVTIHYVQPDFEEDEDENSQMVAEILAILTLYTARASGRKTIASQRRCLSDEQLRRVWHLHVAGHSWASIAEEMRNEQTKNGPVTKRVCINQITLHKKTLMKMYPIETIRSNFEEWARATLVASDTWITRKEVMERYIAYCRSNGLRPLCDNERIYKILNMLGISTARKGKRGYTALSASWVC